MEGNNTKQQIMINAVEMKRVLFLFWIVFGIVTDFVYW